MTKEEIEQAAKDNWDSINGQFINGLNPHAHRIGFIEGSKWAESENERLKAERKWISVETELPEIGEYVEVITEYLHKGKPDSERFIGYMDEYGDLLSIPEDENYGWQFNECVTMWRYLDKPPKQ